MIYWTSDLHFGHIRIREFEPKRLVLGPTLEAHDEALIRRWNEKVTPEDQVYVLGDFALGDRSRVPGIRKRLNGRITLILGNHDKKAARMLADGFDEVHKELELEIDDFKVFMRHYPLGGYSSDKPEPTGEYDYRLCGHVHSKFRSRGAEINVGCDVWDYYPRTFQELIVGIPPGIYPELDWKPDYHKAGK